jgi:bifunctional DNase/RNase
MIPVKVDQLFLSNVGFVVLLKGAEDHRSLPIFIGAPEAQAIAIQLNAIAIPRPLTHDLIKSILDQQECRLRRVEISDLKDGTFYATLVIERDGREMPVDARPSDAIALALRCAAPLFVAEDVMDEAGQVFQPPADSDREKEGEKGGEGRSAKARMTPLDHLKLALEKAIAAERYEEAARLRDEIKRLEHPHSGN